MASSIEVAAWDSNDKPDNNVSDTIRQAESGSGRMSPIRDISDWKIKLVPSAGANPKLDLEDERGKVYILKFPVVRQNGLEIPYHISEYLSCKMAASMGYDVQEAELVTYKGRDAVLITVFEKPLVTFTGFGSSTLSHEKLVYDLDLFAESVQGFKFICNLEEYMWDTFMVDSFICNLDRHPNNWGFFKNAEGFYDKAPLIDLGNSLYSLNAFQLSKMGDVSLYIERFSDSAIKFQGERRSFRDVILAADSKALTVAKYKFGSRLKYLDKSPIEFLRKVRPRYSEYCEFLLKFIKAQEGWYYEHC